MNNQSHDNNRVIKIQPFIKLKNSDSNQTKINENYTKGRKTLNPSSIHLQSPKKENPTRSKRITLFRNSFKNAMKEYEQEFKNQNNNNPPNLEILSNLTLKEPLYNKNEAYTNLIKKIAKILKKRIYLPKCKIFKFYNSYRQLILRIAEGIKKTAKELNFWKNWENNITEKEVSEIEKIASTSCKIIQEGQNKRSKKGINNIGKNSKLVLFKKNETKKKIQKRPDSKNDKIINSLKNIDSSKLNNYFVNQFFDFLKNNKIEICPDTKLPIIKSNNNYLLSKVEFWTKYIIFISRNYKNNLSIYNYVNFIEQFYLWADNNNKENEEFNKEILKQINLLFDQDTINNFLLANKFNNLEDLFSRYKIIDNTNKYSKEIKIDEDCQCETCKSLYYRKVVNYNKKNNTILLAKDNNLSYIIKDKNKNKEGGKKYYDKEISEYYSLSKSKKEKDKKSRSKSKKGKNRKSKSKNKKK